MTSADGGSTDDRYWQQIAEAYKNSGGLDESHVVQGSTDENVQDEDTPEVDLRFVALIHELDEQDYGVPILAVQAGGNEQTGEDEPESILVGYIFVCDNRPEKVVAVFDSGLFLVLSEPEDIDDLHLFRASFVPEQGAFPMEIDEHRT